MTTPDPVTVVEGGATALSGSLLSIGESVLPIAATILALTIGWSFAKRFVRG